MGETHGAPLLVALVPAPARIRSNKFEAAPSRRFLRESSRRPGNALTRDMRLVVSHFS